MNQTYLHWEKAKPGPPCPGAEQGCQTSPMVSEMAELAGDGGDQVLESVEVEEGPMAWPGVPTDPKDSKARN